MPSRRPEDFLPPDYVLAEGLDRFDVARAHAWISRESYWAPGIPLALFETSLRNSLVIGVYDARGALAAMARVITDRATFAWICDVFVDSEQRGRGLSKAILAHIRAHPDLQGLRRMHLTTRDAHEVYRGFGFTELTGVDRWMEVRVVNPYASA
jgi:GNAT superfamily N-acetyltransferase